MSYKTTLRSNIQSVDGSKIKKRNVRIVCANSNAGNTVVSTISQNSSALTGGYKYKVVKGLNAKDFTVKFDVTAGAQYFYDKIKSVMNDTSVETTAPESSNWQKSIGNVKAAVSGTIASITGAPVVSSSDPDMPADSPDPTDTEATSSSSKMILISGAVVLIVLVIALVIWNKKR